MNREIIIQQTLKALEKNGFTTSNFLQSNACFDIIAKKQEDVLIIKVYENIDSIRKDQAEEIKKLSGLLNANCIIIGDKTKVFVLEHGAVYFRHEIPVVTPETFDEILLGRTPAVKNFKGKNIVELDSEKLSELRKDLKLSMAELAEKIGVAAETISRYESGAKTSLETAKKLEMQLNADLVKKVDLFGQNNMKKFGDETPNEELLEKLHELGMKMALFRHSPFKAYGKSENLFIATGKGKFDIPKKALELKKTSTIIDSDSVIVTKEYKVTKVDGIPIISEVDLDSISKSKDLKKFISERENDEDF
ncbi:MAG: hypothetical protein COV47_03080 [Candidatus Diapherotrites archaeon CG11_big_fil_rev_8_21_14_0_20_37_9]|nr:MAG: hypothetical protein COV47_03080 [Candidatus Diapherotrites archaeon CG11_big_fil_rev_8_21_14_0_20_37_9]